MLTTLSLISALIVMLWQQFELYTLNKEMDELDDAAFNMAEELLRLGSPMVYIVEEE